MLNTAGVAGVVALTEKKSVIDTWRNCYFWSFPFYLLGASVAWVFGALTERGHPQSILLLIPVIYLIYRTYRVYLGHLEDEKKHVEQMAALHLRTIEALALAIDAKDHTTHEHLSRVRTYAVELALEMNLPRRELEALRAAALLHDIGKLAVPEHIISKPGKLTPEEFEKMKIHPVVGAEILERVEFPYPVVPIVRSHHEKWDGSGYPDGSVAAKKFPLARAFSPSSIAWTPWLPTASIAARSRWTRPWPKWPSSTGKSFDPQVVAILQRRYVELEKKVHQPEQTAGTPLHRPGGAARRRTRRRIQKSTEPATPLCAQRFEFLDSIGAARLEASTTIRAHPGLGRSP